MPMFEFEGRRYHNPAELALGVIGGRWKMPVLWRLGKRVWRYAELHRALGEVSHKMLAQQLRELERAGLVTRTVYPTVPPRVEYALTDLGRRALPAIEAMREWGSGYRRARRGATTGED